MSSLQSAKKEREYSENIPLYDKKLGRALVV